MKIIYWPIDAEDIRKVFVVHETEQSLLVRSYYERGDHAEYLFRQENKNKDWFETEEAAAASQKRKADHKKRIAKLEKELS